VIVAAGLLGYAALLAWVAPRLLTRGGWTTRAPRLGVIAWQAVCTGVVAGAALAGLAVFVSVVPLSTDLDHLLVLCSRVLHGKLSAASMIYAAFGAWLFLTVATRVGYRVTRAIVVARRHRRRHRSLLAIAGHTHRNIDAVVLHHHAPALYCLPGRHERIVITTAALALLSPDQLAAALAHERAHLRARHDLVVAYAIGLREALPRPRLFRTAVAEVTRLIELLADDAAAQSTDRLTLAEALLSLAAGAPGLPAPPAGLAAAGASASRIRRLLAPPRPLGRTRTTMASIAAAAVFAAPLTSVAGPGNPIGLGRGCGQSTAAAARFAPHQPT
jgi:Zn-dependent protease with chaperone function